MRAAEKFTSADPDLLPDDGKRCELVEGELYISRPTHWQHQYACGRLSFALGNWSDQSGMGEAVMAPGLVFSDSDDVVPDVVWNSHERLKVSLREDGWLHAAPEIIAEVLLPGEAHESFDRVVKLRLYSDRGVQEYWIVDWIRQQVEVYRRKRNRLTLTATLHAQDQLASPLLPGFSCEVARLFFSLTSQKR
ncbi:MAG TPA: Uma2 family endonuclease [Blastocatellia bacterium]|nr:Uma2 family endonuclease [Blastocatellia bacterium]